MVRLSWSNYSASDRSVLLLVFLIVISWAPVFADVSYSAGSSGNKTIIVPWTLDDESPNHILKCIAEGSEGNPLPTLSWIRDDDETSFTGSSEIIVDVSKPEEISITFSPVTYSIVGDYFCVASTPGSEGFASTYTDFRVSVQSPKSTGVVLGAIIVLLGFMGGAFFICKTLRTNDGAVRMET